MVYTERSEVCRNEESDPDNYFFRVAPSPGWQLRHKRYFTLRFAERQKARFCEAGPYFLKKLKRRVRIAEITKDEVKGI